MKDKEMGHTWLIDIAVPEDGRVKDKQEKLESIKIW